MVRFSDDDFNIDYPVLGEKERRRLIADHVRNAEYGKVIRPKRKFPEPTPEEKVKSEIMEADREAKRRQRREVQLLENIEDAKFKLDEYKSSVRSAFALNVFGFFLLAGGITAGFFTGGALGYGAFGVSIVTTILFIFATVYHLMLRYPGDIGTKPDHEERYRNAQRAYNKFLMGLED